MHFIKEIYHLFFPKICACCDLYLVKNELVVCLSCRTDLPITQFSQNPKNKVEQLFYGSVHVEFATALLFYRNKGKTRQLIYELKYRGNQTVGNFFGRWLGNELLECSRFIPVDAIVPVPLDKKKLRKRGYNQLSSFGKCLSKIMNVPFTPHTLIRTMGAETQTRKHRFERWENVEELFKVSEKVTLINKHILLIDDVITTGATLVACAKVLSKVENLKISIVAMAYTE